MGVDVVRTLERREKSMTAEEQASTENPPIRELSAWEHQVIDAVGNAIDFWGFKRNHGRIWALLYLRAEPLTALEIQDTLAISKGAVSMITRELEQWGVIHRVRPPKQAAWHFVAETDLMEMIGRVIRERESGMIARVKQDLEDAESVAQRDPLVDRDVLDRVKRMTTLAVLIEHAIHLFLHTAQLDLIDLLPILHLTTSPSKIPPPRHHRQSSSQEQLSQASTQEEDAPRPRRERPLDTPVPPHQNNQNEDDPPSFSR
jgi:DNA-binding transcriptional regulator GbsR (MarR family)